MPDETSLVAAAAAAAPVEGKPSEAVADAAKTVAESTPKEEATLLGEDGKKEGVTVAPEVKAVVPEKYEIKAPEGMTIDQATLDVITPVFKELGISQEGAQKLADAYAPQISKMIEAQRTEALKAYDTMTNEWKEQTVKELGADHQKELAVAAKALDKFGTPGLRQLLNDTRTGNHIEMVRFMINVGKAISNDSFPDSGRKSAGIDTDEGRAATLFPSNKQN